MLTTHEFTRYAELTCTSNFTFLNGASHPQELVARAAELGYYAIALTDECSLAGIVRAFEETRRCKQNGTGHQAHIRQPVQAGEWFTTGTAGRGHTGYAQLCTLITRGRRNAPKGSYELPDSAFENNLDHCLALWLPERHHDRK